MRRACTERGNHMHNRIILALAAIILIVAVAGCGGGANSTPAPSSPIAQSTQLLHLRGFDVAPDRYRSSIQAMVSAQCILQCFKCSGINWATVTPQSIIDAFKGDMGSLSPIIYSTAVPIQTAVAADDITAAKIIIDECNRIAP